MGHELWIFVKENSFLLTILSFIFVPLFGNLVLEQFNNQAKADEEYLNFMDKKGKPKANQR